MGVTTLKKVCRVNSIGRWPFRKRSSLNRLIQKTREYFAADPQQCAEALAQLEAQRSVLRVSQPPRRHPVRCGLAGHGLVLAGLGLATGARMRGDVLCKHLQLWVCGCCMMCMLWFRSRLPCRRSRVRTSLTRSSATASRSLSWVGDCSLPACLPLACPRHALHAVISMPDATLSPEARNKPCPCLTLHSTLSHPYLHCICRLQSEEDCQGAAHTQG